MDFETENGVWKNAAKWQSDGFERIRLKEELVRSSIKSVSAFLITMDRMQAVSLIEYYYARAVLSVLCFECRSFRICPCTIR